LFIYLPFPLSIDDSLFAKYFRKHTPPATLFQDISSHTEDLQTLKASQIRKTQDAPQDQNTASRLETDSSLQASSLSLKMHLKFSSLTARETQIKSNSPQDFKDAHYFNLVLKARFKPLKTQVASILKTHLELTSRLQRCSRFQCRPQSTLQTAQDPCRLNTQDTSQDFNGTFRSCIECGRSRVAG
jgi:hypothetical protein